MKTPSKELVGLILQELQKGNKSIAEIADGIGEKGVSWASVRDYLEQMKTSGLLIEREDGRKRIFTINPEFVKRKTYFGFSLDRKQEKQSEAIFGLIEKETGKTRMQKIYVEVLEKGNLDIPRGWYLYGKTGLIPYNTDEKHQWTPDFFKNPEEIKKIVKEAIEEYKDCNSVEEIKIKQYETYEKKDYLAYIEIRKLLGKIEKKHKKEFENLYLEILRGSPRIKDSERKEIYSELLNETGQLVVDILDKHEEKIPELRTYMIDAIDSLWELICLYRFRQDISKWYDWEEIERKTGEKLKEFENKTIEKGRELVRQTPEYPIDKETKEFKEKVLSQIKKRTPEEKEEMKKITEKMTDSEIFRLVGLD